MRRVIPRDCLTEKQLTSLNGSPSAAMLRVYRTARASNGKVPPHIKIGGAVYYHREDVEKWLSQKGISSAFNEPEIF
jgi:hypothetical protein